MAAPSLLRPAAMQCLNEDTILTFVEGKLASEELVDVESHARSCGTCEELLALGLARQPSTSRRAMAGQHLSCRFLTPLLDLAAERIGLSGLDGFLRTWGTSVAALRDEHGWVTLRFCEDVVEWLAARIGIEPIIERTLRESYSPKTMGLLYPFVRAFGSPGAGYARVPSFTKLVNRIDDVRVQAISRRRATLSWRPRDESVRERSPLICAVRRAQIAAAPTIWGLPHAVVEETECQARGGDCCVYLVSWAERSHGWRAWLVGALAGAAAYLATGGGRLAALTALIGVVAVHLWSARRALRELRDLEDVRMDALARVAHLPPPITATDSGPPANGAAQPTSALAHLDAEVLPQLGDLLAGRYRVGPLLGAGGMSYVFSARDEASDETVALKLLRPELSLVPRWVERMAREVRIARSIRHPNVCTVMTFGQVGRHHFLTMELASRSLACELRFAAGGKPWDERIADAVAIVSGLGAVHAAGIVHRDLTPQNILRFPEGRLAIADFGLAVDQPEHSTAVAGTPNYIAPEILHGARASFASDIWQLGVILHEVLFGCRPGQAAAVVPAAPAADALRDLCARCVDSVPANRPADVNAIARAIAAADAATAAARAG